MPQFILLLHEDPNSNQPSPSEIQAVIAEYQAWSRRIGEAGQLIGGEKLHDEGGRVLSLQGGEVVVVDGPYAESKEVIGGYFLIEADSYDEAVEISRGCPHLRPGRRIELRQIEVLSG